MGVVGTIKLLAPHGLAHTFPWQQQSLLHIFNN
jgi:hypothetical protein